VEFDEAFDRLLPASDDALLVVVDGDEHCPMTASAKMMTKNQRTTLAQPDVRTCLAPHLGHASAVVLISV